MPPKNIWWNIKFWHFQLFGAFLAWETRNVQIPALNDSKVSGHQYVIMHPILRCTQNKNFSNKTLKYFAHQISWHMWHIEDHVLVCGDVCVQCHDHVCPGGGHHGCPEGPEEHLLHPHLSLYHLLHNTHSLPRVRAQG